MPLQILNCQNCQIKGYFPHHLYYYRLQWYRYQFSQVVYYLDFLLKILQIGYFGKRIQNYQDLLDDFYPFFHPSNWILHWELFHQHLLNFYLWFWILINLGDGQKEKGWLEIVPGKFYEVSYFPYFYYFLHFIMIYYYVYLILLSLAWMYYYCFLPIIYFHFQISY